MVLKLRQMLILLDCGLGQEQLYTMPVREGGLTEELWDATPSTHSANTTADTSNSVHKRKHDQTETNDIRQDWATFLKASTSQFPQKKKKARGSDTVSQSAGSFAPVNASEGTLQSVRPSATREYLFKLPDFSGVDLKSIDVVLISNYNHLLALPYLTEFTDFQGRIFATEPTIEFGR